MNQTLYILSLIFKRESKICKTVLNIHKAQFCLEKEMENRTASWYLLEHISEATTET